MKREYKRVPTQFNVKPNTQGYSLEEQIQNLIANNEPIQADAPMVYTEQKEGVRPEHDIRTDRWEIARKAADNYARSVMAKSAELNKDVLINSTEEKKED